jgi:hypothetical protein
MDILLLSYCLLFLASSGYLGVKFWKKGWTLGNFFLLLILICYVFIPINIIIFGSEIYESSLKTYMTPASKYVSFFSFFVTGVFLLTFTVGGALRGSSSKPVKIYIRRIKEIKLSKAISYFLSSFCLSSLLIYIQQFGDISSLAINLILVRANMFQDSMVGQYAFFGRFINLAIIPLVYFFYEKRKTKLDWIFLLFMPLAILIFKTLFISAGKLNFIILVLLFYFTVCIRRNKLYIHYLLAIGAIVFFALPILDEMFVLASRVFNAEGLLAVPFAIASEIISGSLGKGQYYDFLKDNSESLYLKSVQYFTYIQMSLQLTIDNNYPLLLFKDFLTGISKLLPSRLNIQLGVGVQQLNTSIFYNYYPELPELDYGVPPGIIGLGMYSFSVPGVLIIAFLSGYIFRVIDLFFKSIVEIDKNFSSFYAYTLVMLSIYPLNGDPKEFFYNFDFLVFLFIFFIISFRFETIKNEDEVT